MARSWLLSSSKGDLHTISSLVQLVPLLLHCKVLALARGTKYEVWLMANDEFEDLHEARSESARASESARERASATAQRTADKVGGQMKSFADRIREGGPRVESKIHDTATRLADKLERGASYFTEHQYEGTTRKITQYIRRNPGTSLLIGVAAGVLLAFKRRH
jgi:hypothetical protein